MQHNIQYHGYAFVRHAGLFLGHFNKALSIEHYDLFKHFSGFSHKINISSIAYRNKNYRSQENADLSYYIFI